MHGVSTANNTRKNKFKMTDNIKFIRRRFYIADDDIEKLKNGKSIALDVMNEYITY